MKKSKHMGMAKPMDGKFQTFGNTENRFHFQRLGLAERRKVGYTFSGGKRA